MNSAAPDLTIRARPRAVRRFSRKALMSGGLVSGVIMFGALAYALQSPNYDEGRANELYNVTHKPMADGLELLPKSYGEMKPKQPIALKARPTSLGSYRAPPAIAPQYTAAPQYQAQTEKPNLFFELQTAELGLDYIPQIPSYPNVGAPPSAFDISTVATDQNNQNAKQAFLDRDADDIYNSHGLVSPRSPYQVMAGNLIPASLVTGLNSDLPGQVIGQVTENVYDTVTGQYLLIPQGSRLMGRYDSVIAFGQSRALVVWTRLILPNGDSIQLDNLPGSDSQGFAGLKDKVDRHTWQFIKGAALSSLRFNVIVSRDLILKPYGAN